MPNLRNVCQYCTERHSSCHSHCEKYLEAKAEYEEVKKLERQENMITQFTIDSVLQCKNYRRPRNAKNIKY